MIKDDENKIAIYNFSISILKAHFQRPQKISFFSALTNWLKIEVTLSR